MRAISGGFDHIPGGVLEERVIPFVAGTCVLLWLLARERRLPAGARRLMELAAYAGVALGLLYAIAVTLMQWAAA